MPCRYAAIDTPAARILISLVAIVGITYGAITLLLFMFQHRLVYLPDAGREFAGTPAQAGMKYQELVIETEDGERLAAWLVDAAGQDPAGRGVVLFFHGNAGSLGARLDNLRLFHELGWRTLIVSYRGYGRSSGKPDEQGTYRDATAAWRHLTGPLGVPPAKVVVYGESLGGGVATWLAAREPVAGLIMISAFTSIADLGQALFPLIPVRVLSRIRYDNLQNIAQVRAPILIIHSRDDEIVPFAHAERLAAAALEATARDGAPVTLLELRGDHNNAFRQSAADYRTGIARFLDAVRPGAPPAAVDTPVAAADESRR